MPFRGRPRSKVNLSILLLVRTGRGDAAAATWIFRGDESRRCRGRHVDSPRRRVAATPRPRRGYSAETSRDVRVPTPQTNLVVEERRQVVEVLVPTRARRSTDGTTDDPRPDRGVAATRFPSLDRRGRRPGRAEGRRPGRARRSSIHFAALDRGRRPLEERTGHSKFPLGRSYAAPARFIAREMTSVE